VQLKSIIKVIVTKNRNSLRLRGSRNSFNLIKNVINMIVPERGARDASHSKAEKGTE